MKWEPPCLNVGGTHHVLGWILSCVRMNKVSWVGECTDFSLPLTGPVMWLAALGSCLDFPEVIDYNLELWEINPPPSQVAFCRVFSHISRNESRAEPKPVIYFCPSVAVIRVWCLQREKPVLCIAHHLWQELQSFLGFCLVIFTCIALVWL